MPPKRKFDDDGSDAEHSSTEETTSEEETSSEEEEETTTMNAVDTSAGGQFIANNPNDEAFEVEDDTVHKTPPQGSLNASGAAALGSGVGGGVASAGAPGGVGGNTLSNNPNDEVFEVEGDQRHIPTPQQGGAATAQGRVDKQGASASSGGMMASGADVSKVIKNDKHDEFSDVEDDMEEDEEEADTPPRGNQGMGGGNKAAASSGTNNHAVGADGRNIIANDHHDEAIEINDSSAATTPERGGQHSNNTSGGAQQMQQQQQQQQMQRAGGNNHGQMRPDDDDEDEDEDEEVETSDDDDDNGGQKRMGDYGAEAAAQEAAAAGQGLEYNPADYEYLRKKVPAEVFEIFGMIGQFQATEMELPTKFRPFVPEFIPCVGDIDAFCKVPRPDGAPDGMGLQVIDEPSTHQSNPAVVKMNLEYSSKVAVRNQHVQSVQDAATRPGLIDRWVSEIKETHAKKPLPSVNYSKPMPDIEELLQVWPAEFEELLSSDLQFPPPQIDLDIEQYCRVMCTMLDIPIYDNIIESLHVMFTLFLEFRANQHFQHN